MNKSNGIVLGVIGIIIVIGAWYLYKTPAPTPAVTSAPTGQTTQTQGSSTAPMAASISYTANGFTPDPVTIKVGGTVTFTSIDGSGMWVASNAHPSHAQYDGTTRAEHCASPTATTFDQCKSGKTFSFTFTKVGQWNYHNHVNADDGGTIVVVQ